MSFPRLTAWKAPGEVDDFGIDWSDRLQVGETIASATVAVGGVSLDDSDHTSTTTVARVSGGNPIQTATIDFAVTTSTGRILDGGYSLIIGTPPP